mgnify:FL=1
MFLIRMSEDGVGAETYAHEQMMKLASFYCCISSLERIDIIPFQMKMKMKEMIGFNMRDCCGLTKAYMSCKLENR